MAPRPVMPKADPKTTALFVSLLPADDRILVRPMFGHKAAFVNGHMFAGTFGGSIFVRLDEPSRVELLAVRGAAPFAPMKNRPMREYVQIPESWFADQPRARTWVQRALESTMALPPKLKSASTNSTSSRRPRRGGSRTKR